MPSSYCHDRTSAGPNGPGSGSEVALYLDEQQVEIRYFGYRKVSTAFAFIIENSPRTAQYARSMPQMGQNNIVDYVIYGLMDGVFPPLVAMGPVLLAEFYKEFSIVQNFTTDDYLLDDVLVRMQPNWAGMDKENIPVANPTRTWRNIANS
jgi:hypothetical protein